jgi:dienelactone hydrolase
MRVTAFSRVSGLVVLLCFGGGAMGQTTHRAGPEGEPAGALHEQVWWVPMALPRQPDKIVHLETAVYRPTGTGPFPLTILNHGAPRDPAQRRSSPRQRYFEQSRWFVDRGYVVVIPMRRGYAKSEGDYAESSGACNAPDYLNSGLTEANDIGAVLKYFSTQKFVDSRHVLLVGQSAGGFGAVATASRNPPGVVGIINFAGGRGSQGPDKVCTEDRLVDAMGRFGKTARIPSIWLYAENDLYFRPELSRRMFTAYKSGGGVGEYVSMPPYGSDGHTTFPNWDGSSHWIPAVAKFVNGLPK